MRRNILRVGAALVGLAATWTLSFTTVAPAEAAVRCSTAPNFTRYYTIRHASHGVEAETVECLVKRAGFRAHQNGWISWYDVRGIQAFQRSRGIPATGVVGSQTWSALRRVSARTASRPASSTKGAIALAFAKRQIGDPYRYAASGPNAWDCSGLTMGAWAAAGVRLPHNSTAQYNYVSHKVSRSQLRPGDLVFFYSGRSHVALYAGNGMVLHASHPGAPVGYLAMKYMPYNGAVRPG